MESVLKIRNTKTQLYSINQKSFENQKKEAY